MTVSHLIIYIGIEWTPENKGLRSDKTIPKAIVKYTQSTLNLS